MTYSDVCSLIDQYEVIPVDHAEAIAEALRRKGYKVTITKPRPYVSRPTEPRSDTYEVVKVGTGERVGEIFRGKFAGANARNEADKLNRRAADNP